ncbi:MAG: D-glycero-beta-D-manno-heptose-7-phosphate kinase [Candidatus Acididesulfobacter guangdongensis]|uniref:D-glycero-beta-D-manno-heptose-7-phosphate kinase n=1 Tax=Acididesulfobacter guangdongensis TaxID=2597225 RepID=A0A519BGQ3_ACIG2|nr:MAG: D-glycero-beta-D-manno-heptose-7-phosphate kinase [Candidatus Acididesulfobacter guangdongensis]
MLNNDKLLGIIKKFNKARILVVGDIMIDHYVYGTVSRISPEAPVPVVNVKYEKLLPGGAANVMNNVSRLGAKVFIAGVIGKDYNGDIFKQMADKQSVDSSAVIESDDFETIIKTRVIAHNQQIVRFDKENTGYFKKRIYSRLLDNIKSLIDEFDAVIISDYGKGVIEQRFFNELTDFLKSKNKFIALDPKVENFKFYKNVSILTPNTNEASGGSGIVIKDEKTLLKASQKILKKVNSDNLLITRGELGMSLFYKDNNNKDKEKNRDNKYNNKKNNDEAKHIQTKDNSNEEKKNEEKNGYGNDNKKQMHLKARAKNVFDVTGAGDTVISTLTAAVCAGAGIYEACYIANIAAGIAVSQLGTYAVGADEIFKELSLASCESNPLNK